MKFIILFILLVPLSSFSETKNYKIAEKTRVLFHLPYTLGTHDGEAKISKGKLKLDINSPNSTIGEFSVAIDSMTTGSNERDCHLREALGLNYELSDFPNEHVCNEAHALPTTGKNSIVFPEIIFKILSMKSLDPSGKILTDKVTPIEVEGQWTIHGISKKEILYMKISPEKEFLRVQGDTQFSLKDYNVIVKPGKVLFLTISVKDTVNVSLSILFEAEEIIKASN